MSRYSTDDVWDFEPPEHNSRVHHCIAERRLWGAMITVTAQRAMMGEGTSIAFFRERNGQFALLCSYLNLPEEAIRDRVLSVALQALNQKRHNRANSAKERMAPA
jgi:hypothetical protein